MMCVLAGGTLRGICKVVQSPYHFHHTTPPSSYNPPKVVFQYPIGVLPGQKISPRVLLWGCQKHRKGKGLLKSWGN
jgi:hypothetical protein